MQTIIDRTGDYRTADGKVVNIYKIVDGPYGAFGEFPCGTIQVWDVNGRLFCGRTTEGDIVAKVGYPIESL